MSDNERHTRVLRIRVQADDKYLNDGAENISGWIYLRADITFALDSVAEETSNLGDVKITVEGWEDEA